MPGQRAPSFRRRRLLGAAAVFAPLAAIAPAALARSANSPIPRVYMILFRGETDVEAGFHQWFKDNRLQADFMVRSVDMDASRVPALLEEARAWRADLIYTWGTPVTMAVAAREFDVPIVFTMVSAPIAAGLTQSLASSRRNLTGVSHVVPARQQMSAIQSYRRVDRIGAIFNPNEVNAKVAIREMRAEAARAGAAFNARPVPLDAAGQPRADAIPGMLADFAENRTQLIYIGPDSFIASQRILVTETALALGLPVFSAAEVALRDGSALFGLVAGYQNVGRLTAHKAARILYHRVKPAALPIETPGAYSYLVNMDVARQLGMMPPARVLQFAEQIK
ncbi:putative ABC transport system substrate-binding protein [Duganella sp. CF458]|uniref:ABC transporter substrate-binding protein n=1 Tax=Duganella sp. CF458 TaxID=1884368 RepID=UPI0008E0598E|nr:ABC transporter substrate-binding protein [Duganella sp. CF458]SFG80486.1 putative ABC transport system substrate-binding protein [Duganella sp. CF458]